MDKQASAKNPAAAGERRHESRPRVLKGGLIIFGQMSQSYDCQVRNLTPEGAKLVVATTLGVPEEFQLYVAADHRIAPARIRWRTDRELGVAFIGPWQPFEPLTKTPHPKAARTFNPT